MKRLMPRARKASGAVPADVDPGVLNERAASTSRALLIAGVPLEAMQRAATELETLARLEGEGHELKPRLTTWSARPDWQRWPRLARLLAASAAAVRKPEDLKTQVRFIKRVAMLAGFGVALGMGDALERERSARSGRGRSIRNNRV